MIRPIFVAILYYINIFLQEISSTIHFSLFDCLGLLSFAPFYIMDALAIYAITAGGILGSLFLGRTLWVIANRSTSFSVLYARHLSVPFIVHTHQFGGPWTRVGIFLHVSYAAINVFLVFFRKQSLADAGSRAGELALINLIFPLSTIHLSYLADLLGITWRTCCRIHRATGWMAIALLSFHIVAAVQMRGFSFSFHESANLFTMLV